MRSLDDAELGQPRQIPADGFVRHAEQIHQLARTHATLLMDEVGDEFEAVGRQPMMGQLVRSLAPRAESDVRVSGGWYSTKYHCDRA